MNGLSARERFVLRCSGGTANDAPTEEGKLREVRQRHHEEALLPLPLAPPILSRMMSSASGSR
jgi:hypothetical protein